MTSKTVRVETYAKGMEDVRTAAVRRRRKQVKRGRIETIIAKIESGYATKKRGDGHE